MLSPQAEVTYWGAIGGSDSTTAFQQCADWCGANGEPFTIPDSPLPYRVGAPIQFRATRTLQAVDATPPSDLHFSDTLPFDIVGHGNARVQAVAAMGSMFEMIYNSALSNLGPFYSAVSNVQLDGNGLATACIKSNWVMHVAVERCRLFNAQRGFEVFGYGVFSARHNVVRCLNGFHLSGANNGGGDSLIEANDIYLTQASASGVYMGFYSGDTTIRDNVMTGEGALTGLAGVRMAGGTAPGGEHIRHVNVLGNELYGLNRGVEMAGKSSAAKNVFAVRVAHNHTAPGDLLDGQLVNATDCSEIVVESNFINGKAFADAAQPAIVLTRCEDSIVRGNSAANLKSSFVTMTDCTDCEVFDNKVRDFGKHGTGYVAIDVWGSASRRNQIRRNTIRQTSASYGQYGVAEHAGADYTYMIDNSIYGCSNPLTKVGAHSVATAGV